MRAHTMQSLASWRYSSVLDMVPSSSPTGGSAIGLSATDAWHTAAAGDGGSVRVRREISQSFRAVHSRAVAGIIPLTMLSRWQSYLAQPLALRDGTQLITLLTHARSS